MFKLMYLTDQGWYVYYSDRNLEIVRETRDTMLRKLRDGSIREHPVFAEVGRVLRVMIVQEVDACEV